MHGVTTTTPAELKAAAKAGANEGSAVVMEEILKVKEDVTWLGTLLMAAMDKRVGGSFSLRPRVHLNQQQQSIPRDERPGPRKKLSAP